MSNIIIDGGGHRKNNSLFPNEVKAFREVQNLLRDYGVNDVDTKLTIKPFTQKNGRNYSAIRLKGKQFCCVVLDENKELTKIENNYGVCKFREDISSPDDISSDRIKKRLKGVLRAWGI